MTTAARRLRDALGLDAGASADEVLEAARELGPARRDARAVRAVELEFANAEADGVDKVSALLHVDALDRLALTGVTEPTEGEYMRALAWDATTGPSPSVTAEEPLLAIDSDPNVHSIALTVLKERHALDHSSESVSQSVYDAAVAEARRRLGR